MSSSPRRAHLALPATAAFSVIAAACASAPPQPAPFVVTIATSRPTLVVESHEPPPIPLRHETVPVMTMNGVELADLACDLRDRAPTAMMSALADLSDLHDDLMLCAPVKSRIAWKVVNGAAADLEIADARSDECIRRAFQKLHAKSDGACKATMTITEAAVNRP